MRLRPYKACDAKVITRWLKDEYAFRQWSADRYGRFPISAEDMNRYYDQDKDTDKIWGMTAFDATGNVVGHFTMRYPHAHQRNEIRLGFVIVDDRKRGRGYGKELLSLAISFAFDFIKVEKISLGVFKNNKPAIACYQSCGFQIVELQEAESYYCMGEEWKCLEMELTRRPVIQ